jgi:hypothetical protein
MGSYLYHRYETDGAVVPQAVEGALATLTDDDLSVGSPVTGGCREVGVGTETIEGERYIILRVEGHSGDWTKTSEEAIRRRVEGTDGIVELVQSEGGYEG